MKGGRFHQRIARPKRWRASAKSVSSITAKPPLDSAIARRLFSMASSDNARTDRAAAGPSVGQAALRSTRPEGASEPTSTTTRAGECRMSGDRSVRDARLVELPCRTAEPPPLMSACPGSRAKLCQADPIVPESSSFIFSSSTPGIETEWLRWADDELADDTHSRMLTERDHGNTLCNTGGEWWPLGRCDSTTRRRPCSSRFAMSRDCLFRRR